MFAPGPNAFVVHLNVVAGPAPASGCPALVAVAPSAAAAAADEHDNDMAALSNIWTPHSEISYRMHSTLV